jgi:hypothetical protein
MWQFRFWKVLQCPLCLQEDEFTEHVYGCEDPRAMIASRAKAIQTFDEKIQSLGTATATSDKAYYSWFGTPSSMLLSLLMKSSDPISEPSS